MEEQFFWTRFIYNQYISDHIIHFLRAQVEQTRFYNVDEVECSSLQKLPARNYFYEWKSIYKFEFIRAVDKIHQVKPSRFLLWPGLP